MATKRDYYDGLGVPRDASDEEIKRAFRRAAQRHHPDIDGSYGAEQRLKELNETSRSLSNRHSRTSNDMYGPGGSAGGDGGAAGESSGEEGCNAALRGGWTRESGLPVGARG